MKKDCCNRNRFIFVKIVKQLAKWLNFDAPCQKYQMALRIKFFVKQEKLRQTSERARKRKRIMSNEEKSRLSTEYCEEREREEVRQCYGPGCTNAARSGSKYCSDECGIQLAVR